MLKPTYSVPKCTRARSLWICLPGRNGSRLVLREGTFREGAALWENTFGECDLWEGIFLWVHLGGLGGSVHYLHFLLSVCDPPGLLGLATWPPGYWNPKVHTSPERPCVLMRFHKQDKFPAVRHLNVSSVKTRVYGTASGLRTNLATSF